MNIGIYIIGFFQLFYIVSFMVIALFRKQKIIQNDNKKLDKISIIIPLYNSEKTIEKNLNSILRNNTQLIEQIVIVLDRCTDNSSHIIQTLAKKFTKAHINFIVTSLSNSTGKASAILEGLKYVKSDTVMLLDADIVLHSEAIQSLLTYHVINDNLYTSCFIYPYQINQKSRIVSSIIQNDRLYRQNILQTVRNAFNTANFPGGIGIVNVPRYKKVVSNGFLEDLTATYNILSSNKIISILNIPLAFEIERETIKGAFLQRIRWTIGNIHNQILFIKTMKKTKGFIKKMLVLSYPLMWYIQHYVISIYLVLFLLSGMRNYVFLMPIFLYFIQIVISANYGRKEYKNSIIGIPIHSLVFPFIITFALFGAICTLLIKRKIFFENSILFKRM